MKKIEEIANYCQMKITSMSIKKNYSGWIILRKDYNEYVKLNKEHMIYELEQRGCRLEEMSNITREEKDRGRFMYKLVENMYRQYDNSYESKDTKSFNLYKQETKDTYDNSYDEPYDVNNYNNSYADDVNNYNNSYADEDSYTIYNKSIDNSDTSDTDSYIDEYERRAYISFH